MATEPLRTNFNERTINELSLLFRGRQINLDPGFQRKSVWTDRDRRSLIESIVKGFPIPSVFLYQRTPRGKLVYDVIDGKQRIETLFMFTRLGRFKRKSFGVKLDLGDGLTWYDWTTIRRYFPNVRANFEAYKIPTIEVTGDLAQIIDLFVKINSTGKRLTSGEKRHARYFTSPFLKEADKLVTKYHKFLREQHILSPAQIDRMKGTELFAELLMSIHNGGPINKKAAIDSALKNETINGNTLARVWREVVRTMHLCKRMFPHLRETRFHNSVEFYTLFLLIWEMQNERLILTDRRRNRLAFEMLRRLSTGVDQLRDQQKRVSIRRRPHRLYSEYPLTVQGDTDSSANRERRRQILKDLLVSIYERKDEKRTFSPEQRRIIWNSEDKRNCARCHKPLTWSDFTVDHIIAYAKGGKTNLKNAQPMHRTCNSSKGARTVGPTWRKAA